MRYLLLIPLLSLLLIFSSCEDPFYPDGDSDGDTIVEIRMIDQTGQLNPSQSYIMSIYDPNDESDYRYSQYSTKREVKFTNVTPGLYRAHVTSEQHYGENTFDLTVNKGDNILIVFTYYYAGSITVGYITVPIYKWMYQVTRR